MNKLITKITIDFHPFIAQGRWYILNSAALQQKFNISRELILHLILLFISILKD